MDPAAIYQAHLDVGSVLFWDRDFEGLAAGMALPNSVALPEETVRFEDRAGIAAHFADFREEIAALGATGYMRMCLAAELGEAGRIHGRHQSFVLKGGARVREPYECEMWLVEQDGAWLARDLIIHAPHGIVRDAAAPSSGGRSS